MSRNNKSDTKPNEPFQRASAWQKALTMLLIVMSIGSLLLFITSYQKLNASIENERVASIMQLGTLIADKVLLLEQCYIETTDLLATALVNSEADTLSEVRRLFDDRQNVFLVTADRSYWALDGSKLVLSNDQLILNLLVGSEVQSSFGTIYGQGDYWLFSTPLTGITIDNTDIIGLVNMVAASRYAEIAAVPLYDGMGASYVVGSDGAILMRPTRSEISSLFDGYNLLNILKQKGIPAEKYAALKEALAQGEKSQFTVSIDNVIWLIQSVPMEAGRSIVITVPVSMTAQETFASMKNAIFSMALLIISLLTLLLLWLLFYYRKNQVNELKQAKTKAKNDFLDKMSHDIRTPLNAIIGMHELALRSIDDRAAVYDSLLKAKRSSQYLVAVINDVLDMSKIESGKMSVSHEPFNMTELLAHIEQMEKVPAQEKKLDFSVDIRHDIETDFVGDSVRIQQCLVNLISNAIKFTPEGGRVTVIYESQTLASDRCLVTFTVADTGIGMSEEFLKRIFDPFEQEQSSFTSTYVGSGLGLAIVHHLVGLMAGEIVVESVLGQGSRFTIRLPFDIIPRQEAAQGISDEELMAAIAGRQILLVEDNAINREIMCELLMMLGLVVVQAENGREAVECFAASPPGFFALILMDIKMPVMDGLEAAAAIRALDHPDSQRVPIVALSANAYQEDMEKSTQAGMQAHLAKPIEMESFKKLLKQYIY